MARANLPVGDTRETTALVERIISARERARIPTIPIYAGSPPELRDGLFWIDSTTGLMHVRINGTTRTVTLS